MALTIHQEPTSPNIANSDLLYVITSTQVSQPQFQYVCDIKDANDNLIQRIKQQPNPSNRGVFNLSQIMVNSIGETDTIWNITTATTQSTCAKDFKVYFGEEYGTSVSSSITLYNGQGSSGAPATTSSLNYYFNLDGFLNPQQLVNWNWNSGSFLNYEAPSTNNTFSHQNGLTFFTTQSVRRGDYHTISFLNGNVAGDAPQTGSAQDVYAMEYKAYDATGSLVDTFTFYNTAGPRDSSADNWTTFNAYLNQDETTRIIHWPVGPQNFFDATYAITESAVMYDVIFYGQNFLGDVNDNAIWGSYRFNIVDEDCAYEGVRFAWKNQFGVWDYYTFNLAESRVSNVSRLNYEKTFVDYSTTGTIVSYDNTRRGNTNFYNDITKNRTANSDWLNQTDADLVRELFFSTNVFVFQPQTGEWWPVVITNASITEKTNPRNQKLFQYTAEYQYSNTQQDRLY